VRTVDVQDMVSICSVDGKTWLDLSRADLIVVLGRECMWTVEHLLASRDATRASILLRILRFMHSFLFQSNHYHRVVLIEMAAVIVGNTLAQTLCWTQDEQLEDKLTIRRNVLIQAESMTG